MSVALRSRSERRLQAAQGYLVLGMPDHALLELDAVAVEERGFAWQVCRAECQRERRDHAVAIEHFQNALEEDPQNLHLLMGLAWCLKRNDQLSAAIDAMHRAYDAHPAEPVVLYNLACYYSLAREKAQALSWLGRALRMESGLTKLIAEEPDFDPLRSDPDFRFIVDAVAAVAASE